MPVIHKQVELTLALTPSEALWLKLNMQNPVGAENSTDYNMRKGFFDALPEITELEALQK